MSKRSFLPYVGNLFSMNTENTTKEYKSLKKITSGDAGFKELATTAVCLANAQGGTIYIGFEDKTKLPPPNQVITSEMMNKTITRLRSLCFNTGMILNGLEKHQNGGAFLALPFNQP